ncbi:acetyl-CoA synthetase [Chytridiales sp. JEL 0842]|nr:acetyl-CoA synthetase [Chytridiales sp. JEL 0842]
MSADDEHPADQHIPTTPPPARLLDASQCPAPHISSMKQYQDLYKESIENPDAFFRKMSLELLTWMSPPTSVKARHGGFYDGDITWFKDGTLNVSQNCIDRHAEADPDRVAMIWDADEPGNGIEITYGTLLKEVCRFANVLKKYKVRKGDTVAIYMPMVPEAVYAMLACTRIGAVHSVVFAGFSADALRDRISDADCRFVITADQGKRGGKIIHLKQIADEAVSQCPDVKTVVVFQRTGDATVPFNEGRDVWWHEEVKEQRPYCPPEPMNAEDPMFMLYTSGSTGKPKGVVHTTAGYLLGVTMTSKYVFDMHQGDIHGCMADVGWITGHSYIVYGPLSCGVTTFLFESVPFYPNPSRYWECVDTYKITQLYTAPTAIRALRRYGDEHVKPYSLESLRVLGSVGEPINPEAWEWYNTIVGRKRCAIVDTYWQTETGSIIVTPLPAVTPTKPGAATLPFFGVELAVLDANTGKELVGNNVTGVLAVKKPFPSIARTVHMNHARYLDTYMKPYHGYYFTGDGVTRDADGYYWIRGRVDDVINVAGHRLSTAEIESALIAHPSCAEAAVVGVNDDVTGQAIVCYCTLKSSHADATAIVAQLRAQVRSHIGPFATPKAIVITPDLPKTRSGKIMRRILRKVAAKEVTEEDVRTDEGIRAKLGDVSTLSEPGVIPMLVERVKKSGL